MSNFKIKIWSFVKTKIVAFFSTYENWNPRI